MSIPYDNIPVGSVWRGLLAASIGAALLYYVMTPRKRKTIPDAPTKGNPNDAIVLFGLPSFSQEASSMSPFTSKLETFLRMAGLPYTARLARVDAHHAPKGKLPSIQHGDVIIADTTFIIKYLYNTYGSAIKIQPARDAAAAAVATAVQRLVEDHLFWVLAWKVWGDDEGFEGSSKEVFKMFPWYVRFWVKPLIHSKVRRQTWGQGISRHSMTDIDKLMIDDLRALSDIIGDKPYITGDQPVPEDAAVFAVLDSMLNATHLPPVVNGMAPLLHSQFPVLTAYVQRIRDAYYPERATQPSKLVMPKA